MDLKKIVMTIQIFSWYYDDGDDEDDDDDDDGGGGDYDNDPYRV